MIKLNKIECSKSLAVLAVATTVGTGFPEFLESCRRQGINPILLGYGQQWRFNWTWKLDLVAEILPSLDADLVAVVDCFDSVFVRNSGVIINRFEAFQHPFVCSTQLGVWPDPDVLALHPPSPTPYRTLNAGAFMGSRVYLQKILEKFWTRSDKTENDDQRFWTRLYLENNDILKPDYKQEIFGSCGDTHLHYVPGSGIRNRITGSFPAHFHGNGGTRMINILGWEGLSFAAPNRRWLG